MGEPAGEAVRVADSVSPLSPPGEGLTSATALDREEVVHYPTDFSVMSQEDIQRLSGRGEAITRALTTQYLLSD